MALGPLGRTSARFPVKFQAQWKLEKLGIGGEGVIRDLSLMGASIQLDKDFVTPTSTLVFTLSSLELPALPRQARLRWFRRPAFMRGRPVPGYLCGVIFEFETPAQEANWETYLGTISNPLPGT